MQPHFIMVQMMNWWVFRYSYDPFLTQDQGKRSNLMHECIAQMCINFYYGSAGGSVVLARRFPADFKHTVPEYAIAIVATCVSHSDILYFCLTFLSIYHCIDEYSFGYRKKFKFTGEEYNGPYQSILEVISNIRSNQYHKEKWDRTRRDWARRGMWVFYLST